MKTLNPTIYDCTVTIGKREETMVIDVAHHVQDVFGYIKHRIQLKFGDQSQLRWAIPRLEASHG